MKEQEIDQEEIEQIRHLKAEARAELLARLKREQQRRAAMTNLADFTLYTYDHYLMGWFHRTVSKALDDFLAAVIAKQSPRLIITAPPRSGKSEEVSRRFPAYALGRYPFLQIIATSYSVELTMQLNQDVQRIIDNEKYHELFPGTTLQGSVFAPKSPISYARKTDLFQVVNNRGQYRSTGVGGPITGMGADILIIDDPVKDREAARSATIRNKTWDWYTSTAYTRLSPGGGVIIMATRWHCDDLIGRLLARMQSGEGETFQIVNFPAIAEEDEEFRKKGEALHPERFTVADFQRIRENIGEMDFAALYQQHPLPEGGAMFKEAWLQYYTPETKPRRFDALVMSWDMTFKGTASSDFVVGQVWGRAGGNFYLLDQVRGQFDFVQTLDQFVHLSDKWPDVVRKLIEDKANGPAIITTLRDKISGIIPVTPKESKEARANSVTTLWEAHNVYLPDPKYWPWVAKEFLPELLSFPSSAHDDQVDAMTQALNDMKIKGRGIHPSNLQYLGFSA